MRVVYATGSAGFATSDGAFHTVRYGQHWPEDDPVVKAAPPGLFSPDPRYGLASSVPPADDPPVEQATAAPGERRAAVRRG
jgi:hypothetical protein